MRPVSFEQSVLECPLNELLGTTASVRLLRILVANRYIPVGLSDLASDAGLTIPGARKALQKLVALRLVERIGAARTRLYALDANHWLTPTLANLFGSEEAGYQALLTQLKKVLSGHPEIDAAWAEQKEGIGARNVDIHVLVSARHAQGLRRKLQSAYGPLEHAWAISVTVVVITHAELPDSIPAERIWLWGVVPFDHQGQASEEVRTAIPAARWSSAIAVLLDRKPSLIPKALRHVELLLEQGQGMANHDLKEWHDILSTYSVAMLQDFLNMDSERADRLLRSAPFLPVLSHKDKIELLKYIKHDL